VLAAVRALVPTHPTRHPRQPRQTEVRLPGRLPHQGRRAIGARPGARPPRRPLGPRPSREAKQWRWWAGTADPQRAAGPLARPPANQQGPPAANRRPLPPTAGPPRASLPRREPRRLAWDSEHPTAVRPAGPCRPQGRHGGRAGSPHHPAAAPVLAPGARLRDEMARPTGQPSRRRRTTRHPRPHAGDSHPPAGRRPACRRPG